MILWELFLAFLRVGCFTFGGGYGAVPLIREVVLSRGWLSEETLAGMIAVSESTPGPIMVNMATYIGSSQAGFWGAVVATLAVVLPSFCIILLVMVALKNVLRNPWAQAALRGLKPCVIGIILATGAYMIFGSCISAGRPDGRSAAVTGLLALVLLVCEGLLKKKLSPIVLIGIAAVLGALVWGAG